MNPQVLGAMIGAGATLVAGSVTELVKWRMSRSASSTYRQKLGLPDALGRWKCDWWKEDGSLYVTDVVEIKKWVKNGRFEGYGMQPTLTYRVNGEVDGTKVMALTYRTEDFPTKSYVGVACLELDQDGEEWRGYWYGRAKTGEFMGGRVKWSRA